MSNGFLTYIGNHEKEYPLVIRRETTLAKVAKLDSGNVEAFVGFAYSVLDAVYENPEKCFQAKRGFLGYMARRADTPEMVEYFVEKRRRLRQPVLFDVASIDSVFEGGFVE